VRLVLDTNVLIAALIARGTAHRLYEYCVRQHTIVGSQFILDELHEKLVKKFKYSAAIAAEAIRLLQSRMEIIAPVPLNAPVCRDADTTIFLQ
jgi:putative PIN family toxin of toxin-antitoxin system